MNKNLPPLEILQWYQTAGVDETAGTEPVDRFALPKQAPAGQPVLERFASAVSRPAQPENLLFNPPEPAVQTSGLAEKAKTLEELRRIILDFDECPLKATASNLVFGAGNPQADVMIIGEAPGAEEDRQGLPFVGASGHLLDLMLKSIRLDRTQVYISNILPWRPPGNRKPSESEVALFTPFVRRHIALVNPKVLLLLGGSAVSALMHTNAGITRSRGRWMQYTEDGLTIDALASFHPAFLLRTPAQKKLSWRDFLMVRHRLDV